MPLLHYLYIQKSNSTDYKFRVFIFFKIDESRDPANSYIFFFKIHLLQMPLV